MSRAFGEAVTHAAGARLAAFVHRYGWRAWALPILSVITVAALMHTSGQPGARQAAAPAAASARTGTHGARSGPTGRVTRVEGGSDGDAGFAAGATPDPTPLVIRLGDDTTSCAANTFDTRIVVSIREQHLWACEGHRQVDETAVTTGSVVHHDQTPLGSWRVQAKQRDRYLVGPGYRDYVRYWVPFNGDFGLHDASWQKMPFGSPDWTTRGSHGCVHTPTPTMAWLYHWVTPGKTVVTVES